VCREKWPREKWLYISYTHTGFLAQTLRMRPSLTVYDWSEPLDVQPAALWRSPTS
jgi:hypothetical protein